jgi:hypothetical protein
MYDPVLSASTESSLTITWAALTADALTGGSAITSYKLEWDQGTGTWLTLVGDPTDDTSLTYTVSSGLTAGDNYKFRLTAKNIYGWGVVSNQVTMTPLGVPTQPDPVTTTISATNVKIEWTDPTSTNGAAITAY